MITPLIKAKKIPRLLSNQPIRSLLKRWCKRIPSRLKKISTKKNRMMKLTRGRDFSKGIYDFRNTDIRG